MVVADCFISLADYSEIARLESLILLRNCRHLPCHTDTGYHLTTHQTKTSRQNRPTVHPTKPRVATNTETCATKILCSRIVAGGQRRRAGAGSRAGRQRCEERYGEVDPAQHHSRNVAALSSCPPAVSRNPASHAATPGGAGKIPPSGSRLLGIVSLSAEPGC